MIIQDLSINLYEFYSLRHNLNLCLKNPIITFICSSEFTEQVIIFPINNFRLTWILSSTQSSVLCSFFPWVCTDWLLSWPNPQNLHVYRLMPMSLARCQRMWKPRIWNIGLNLIRNLLCNVFWETFRKFLHQSLDFCETYYATWLNQIKYTNSKKCLHQIMNFHETQIEKGKKYWSIICLK